MLMRIILSIGFMLSGLMGVNAFRYCHGKSTTLEFGTLLGALASVFGLALIWVFPKEFSATHFYGYVMIGFCWLVIISNMVLTHHVKVEMRK